jgi:hypothetical protein
VQLFLAETPKGRFPYDAENVGGSTARPGTGSNFLQRILGHLNRTTTEIYPHASGAGEVEAVKVLVSEIG